MCVVKALEKVDALLCCLRQNRFIKLSFGKKKIRNKFKQLGTGVSHSFGIYTFGTIVRCKNLVIRHIEIAEQ